MFRPFITPTSVCTNSTTQIAYLTKILTLINNFQTNATYNSVLQIQSTNFVSYITNSTNQGLLYSNCTGYVIGLQKAKLADKVAERTRQRIAQDIYRRIRQVPRDVTGSNGPNDMDSSELHGYHF